MENTKRTIILLLCVIFALSPLMNLGSFSYADNPPSGGGAWDPVTDEKTMVAAFKAYCERQNFDISHVPNTVKAIVKWDYNELQKWAALANVDLETINAQIWYGYDSTGKLKFFYENGALVQLSRLYATILQDERLVADYNTTKNVYSGVWFEDLDGNGCFVYMNRAIGTGSDYISNINKSDLGSIYQTSGGVLFYQLALNESITKTFNFSQAQQNISINFTRSYISGTVANAGNLVHASYSNSKGKIYQNITNVRSFIEGHDAIFSIKTISHPRYFYGTVLLVDFIGHSDEYEFSTLYELQASNTTNSNINYNIGEPPENIPTGKSMEVTTNETTINNYLTKNSDSHDTYNYYDNDTPPEPPSYTNPYDDNPTGGVINPDGSINFQMPDLNIDWHLNLDTSNLPFPFSIPYDMINFFNAFSTEPVTPHIQENLTIYNMSIPIDIDLEWLDDVAGYFRTFLLLSYVFGLIIATRALFHIY